MPPSNSAFPPADPSSPDSGLKSLQQALESWRHAGLSELPQFNPASNKSFTTPEAAVSSAANSASAACNTVRSPDSAMVPSSSNRLSNSSLVINMSDNVTTEAKQTELEQLRQQVAACTLCQELAQTRTQTVFGVGNVNARLLFLGEAPGADEDAQGIPFVGRSGRLLTDMLEKGMKISREDIYICNILRCRPPGNRNPSTAEANCCRPFFEAQIKTVNPEFICCLGTVAAQNLLQTTTPIGRLRGQFHDWQGYKVLCTYHPSYLLRNPPAKKDAWADLQILMRAMGMSLSDN